MFEATRTLATVAQALAMIPVVAPRAKPWRAAEWRLDDGVHHAAKPSGAVLDQRTHVAQRRVFLEYEPGTYLPWVSPTPLLMVVAAGDHLTVSDLAIDAYERAREPKRLELLPGGHFDAYNADFERSSGAAPDWFVTHLLAGTREHATA